MIWTEPSSSEDVVVSYGQYACLILVPFFVIHSALLFLCCMFAVMGSGVAFLDRIKLPLLASTIVMLVYSVAIMLSDENELFSRLNLSLYFPFIACDLTSLVLVLYAMCSGRSSPSARLVSTASKEDGNPYKSP